MWTQEILFPLAARFFSWCGPSIKHYSIYEAGATFRKSLEIQDTREVFPVSNWPPSSKNVAKCIYLEGKKQPRKRPLKQQDKSACSMCSFHALSVTLQSLQRLEAKVVFMLGWYLIELTWTKLPASTYDRFTHKSLQTEKWHLSTFHQNIWHLNNWFWFNSEKCHHPYGKPAIGLSPWLLPSPTMALPEKLLKIYVPP